MATVSKKVRNFRGEGCPCRHTGLTSLSAASRSAASFMVPPDPYDNRGKNALVVNANFPRGDVNGSGDEKTFRCGAYGRQSILKNNKAVVEEYRRLRRRFKVEPPRDVCFIAACENHVMSLALHPELHRMFGKTAKGSTALEMQDVPVDVLRWVTYLSAETQ